MNRRDLLQFGLAAGLAAGTSGIPARSSEQSARNLPEARYDRLPRWRGFNLLEKFNGTNRRFREDDFRRIADFGFNFVRLPMDYRAWIGDNDWRKIDEKALEDIDEAIRFGEKYGVHVCLNFHRAPGYTVARPAESKNLWTDTEAREVCALHWRTFAKRYRGLPNNLVSFNLFNEPDRVSDIMDQCIAAHRHVIDAIRTEDGERLILCDGYDWATKPFARLTDLKVAQATRGYAPMEISHYKASWVDSKNFVEPAWPMIGVGNGLLVSPSKKEVAEENRAPLVVRGPFPTKTRLRFRVGTVSGSADLVVSADGDTIFERKFKPGPGEGEWKTVVYAEKWNTYQNIYDRDYEATIPAGTKTLELRIERGDWLTIASISLRGERVGRETAVSLTPRWGKPPSLFEYRETEAEASIGGSIVMDRAWLKKGMEPWLDLQKRGVGVMVGEFGAFNKTPHEIALRWLEDMLSNWKEAGWGFALWNFAGSFGILDSERSDVAYEDFEGHKLDRKMLELMQRY